MQNTFDDLKNQSNRIKNEIKETTTGYIIAALSLVCGLAWNEAIKSAIDYLFPLSENSIFAKLAYAIFITLIVVIFSAYILRSRSDKK